MYNGYSCNEYNKCPKLFLLAIKTLAIGIEREYLEIFTQPYETRAWSLNRQAIKKESSKRSHCKGPLMLRKEFELAANAVDKTPSL